MDWGECCPTWNFILGKIIQLLKRQKVINVGVFDHSYLQCLYDYPIPKHHFTHRKSVLKKKTERAKKR